MKKLTVDRYNEFLRILDKAYKTDSDRWFMNTLSHIYADDEEVRRGCEKSNEMVGWNYYSEEDGEILSGLAIFLKS